MADELIDDYDDSADEEHGDGYYERLDDYAREHGASQGQVDDWEDYPGAESPAR